MSDKNRLLVITELFMPTKGGTAVWFDEVYRRLGGKEIHIVTADVPGAVEHDQNHANSVHRLKLKRTRWLRPESLGMYIKLFLKCFSLMIIHRFDAIHAGRVLPEGLVGWCIARIFRKPLVIYAHGEEITTWRQRGKFKAMVFAYTHADKVIANSEFTRQELLKIGVAESNIVLIHPGVDVDRFRPGLLTADLKQSLGCDTSSKVILSVGRLSRRKGFDLVIRCMPVLLKQNPDLHYAIIGIGEDREYLNQLAIDSGVKTNVHFLGHVSVDDLPRWYNTADIFVMPNREIDGDTEGFGMVFIEASACGTPVIAGKAGGTDCSVKDGLTGYKVDGNASKQFIDRLNELLDSEDSNISIRENARVWAMKNFSWDRIASLTKSLV